MKKEVKDGNEEISKIKLVELKCVNENVDLNDYYFLYDKVKEHMEYSDWLGYIPYEETVKILNNGGKIWLYYEKNEMVCSMMYIPASNKSLKKHNIEVDEKITGSLGPIMVNHDYFGNSLMMQMLEVFDEYNKEIGNKYIFTKAVKDNIFCINNLKKNGYELVDGYVNERGINNAFLKKLDICDEKEK